MRLIFSQIIGLLAVVTFLMSYQQKRRKSIIIWNVTSRVLYIIQYLLLGAYSGAVLDVLGVVSSVIAEKKHTTFIKKHLKAFIIGINTIILLAGLGIAIINRNFLDVFPIIGVLLHTGAFWISKEKIIRWVSLLGSPFWLVYNLLNKAYGSAIGDILTIASIIIAIIKYRKENNVTV